MAEQITTKRVVSTSTPKAPASVDRRVLTRLNKKSEKTWSSHNQLCSYPSLNMATTLSFWPLSLSPVNF